MGNLEPSEKRNRLLKGWILGLLFIIVAAGILVTFFRYWLRKVERAKQQLTAPYPETDLQQFQGLSQAEVEARRSPSRSEEQQREVKQVRRSIWRTSIFSIFNLSLVGLAAVQWFLNDSLGALGSLVVLFLSIILTAGQQLFATSRVEKLLPLAQPAATVIRDGHIRSIDAENIVTGDVLVIGPGDQFLVDGEVLTETQISVRSPEGKQENSSEIRVLGDSVKAGSYCLEGRAAIRAVDVTGSAGSPLWNPAVSGAEEQTPLQRIMSRLLRVLLVVVAIFLTILLLDLANFAVLPEEIETLYRDSASVVFSIAPSGLFFMIVVTYALGSARIGNEGALVRESQAIESLAQISILCFSKAGTLTGAETHLEMADNTNGHEEIAESRVRQVLGDFSHTIRHDNLYLQSLADNFEGSPRQFLDSAQYLSAYGWSAMTFQEADLRGTYVIGVPAVLDAFLASEEAPALESINDERPGILKQVDRLGQLFGTEKKEEDETGRERTAPSDRYEAIEEEPGNLPFFSRIQREINKVIELSDDDDEQTKTSQETGSGGPQLVFAYLPEVEPLYDAAGNPELPGDLIPICYLKFEERVRPEARESIQAFKESGVRVKILSAEEPEYVAGAAIDLGLIEDYPAAKQVISGRDLVQMDRSQIVDPRYQNRESAHQNGVYAGQNRVYARLMPEQRGEIVQRLRDAGERVAVVGDGLDDIPAMEESNLNITLQSSSQATLGAADIILLRDSLQLLPATLKQGQQIVNGLLDILKINIAQVSYIFLLLVAMLLDDRPAFYYHPTQGGVIAFFTVIAPSLGLTIWASAGALPRRYMSSRLWHFIVPAAVTMAVAVLGLSEVIFELTNNVAETEQAVTYGLVLMGLILVIFVQPPARFFVGGDVLSGDWRNTYLAIGLFILYNVLVWIPLAQNLFRLAPLSELWEYPIIFAIALVWALILRTLWRSRWLTRYVGILSSPFVAD
jgi:magnesium-transporting ATPase (P-type)